MNPLTLFLRRCLQLDAVQVVLVLHQLLHGFLNIIRLRQNEIFELRGVAYEGVGGADAADGGVEVFEKLVGDAGGDLGSVTV